MGREIVPCNFCLAQMKAVDSPSLGREGAFALWPALPGSIGWGCWDTVPSTLWVLWSDPRQWGDGEKVSWPDPWGHCWLWFNVSEDGSGPGCHCDLWCWYGLRLAAETFHVILFKLYAQGLSLLSAACRNSLLSFAAKKTAARIKHYQPNFSVQSIFNTGHYIKKYIPILGYFSWEGKDEGFYCGFSIFMYEEFK